MFVLRVREGLGSKASRWQFDVRVRDEGAGLVADLVFAFAEWQTRLR